MMAPLTLSTPSLLNFPLFVTLMISYPSMSLPLMQPPSQTLLPPLRTGPWSPSWRMSQNGTKPSAHPRGNIGLLEGMMRYTASRH